MRTPMHVIVKDLEERVVALKDSVSSGAAKDFAEYKSMCGEIRGLSHAHIYLNDLVRRIENGQDE